MGKQLKGILTFFILIILLNLFFIATVSAGEDLYDDLLEMTRGEEGVLLLKELNDFSRGLDWSDAREVRVEGDLRHLTIDSEEGKVDDTCLYLIRSVTEDIYILALPDIGAQEDDLVLEYYEDLAEETGSRSNFHILLVDQRVNGEEYTFARLLDRPQQLVFHRVFEICCTLMLFLIMVGMGLTLRLQDFGEVFKKPGAMLIGAFLQWVIMPLIAVGTGLFFGYHESYPFIYIGLVLITVSPGGTSSNLMTYFGRGDLALSISLTSFSTVLSLVLTPLLLTLYCANISNVPIPAGLIMQIILALVLIPLTLGMFVRGRCPNFAEKAVPYFSKLGIIALILIIGTGVATNLEKFADTERYGLQEYLLIMFLTFTGIVLGGLIPKIFGVNNYQARAISMENGLRNSILAMTIAVLLQDRLGDFHSSMFAVSAIFGIGMYFSGFAAIYLFKRFLPLEKSGK